MYFRQYDTVLCHNIIFIGTQAFFLKLQNSIELQKKRKKKDYSSNINLIFQIYFIYLSGIKSSTNNEFHINQNVLKIFDIISM